MIFQNIQKAKAYYKVSYWDVLGLLQKWRQYAKNINICEKAKKLADECTSSMKADH